jgi:hypothetical protein
MAKKKAPSKKEAPPKKQVPPELWKHEPDEHDYPAASDYLSLILAEAMAAGIVERLRAAALVTRKAKDLIRSSGLPLLPADDPEVAKDLRRVSKNESLSPVLLVRGEAGGGRPLIVADGYHRICASYHLSEDADIPCRIVDLE